MINQILTNEEIVAEIQSGAVEKLPELWEGVRGFVYQKAVKWFHAWQHGRPGIEIDDLTQSGYIGMCAAVESFDETKGASFLTWLNYYLRTAFSEAIGCRTQKEREDAINVAERLEDLLTEDLSVGETIADPDSETRFCEIENEMYILALREALGKALEKIQTERAETIRKHFFFRMTLEEIAQEEKTSVQLQSQRKKLGLAELRRRARALGLAEYIEDMTPYYKKVGAERFNETRTSAVEAAVLQRDKMWERIEEGRINGQ